MFIKHGYVKHIYTVVNNAGDSRRVALKAYSDMVELNLDSSWYIIILIRRVQLMILGENVDPKQRILIHSLALIPTRLYNE